MKPHPPPFHDLTALNKARRVLVAVLGGTVLGFGLALIVLPGPAFVVIPLGLAILAVEFTWARRWLRSVRAILPLRGAAGGAPKSTAKRIAVHPVRRSAAVLLRQIRRGCRRCSVG